MLLKASIDRLEDLSGETTYHLLVHHGVSFENLTLVFFFFFWFFFFRFLFFFLLPGLYCFFDLGD